MYNKVYQMKIPIRYLPKKLTRRDKKKQLNMLLKSKKMYKQHKYYTRKSVASYKNKKSSHLSDASRIYNIKNITPNQELVKKNRM